MDDPDNDLLTKMLRDIVVTKLTYIQDRWNTFVLNHKYESHKVTNLFKCPNKLHISLYTHNGRGYDHLFLRKCKIFVDDGLTDKPWKAGRIMGHQHCIKSLTYDKLLPINSIDQKCPWFDQESKTWSIVEHLKSIHVVIHLHDTMNYIGGSLFENAKKCGVHFRELKKPMDHHEINRSNLMLKRKEILRYLYYDVKNLVSILFWVADILWQLFQDSGQISIRQLEILSKESLCMEEKTSSTPTLTTSTISLEPSNHHCWVSLWHQ